MNPSSSGWGDTIRLTATDTRGDNKMSGFAACIDCGEPWQVAYLVPHSIGAENVVLNKPLAGRRRERGVRLRGPRPRGVQPEQLQPRQHPAAHGPRWPGGRLRRRLL